MILRKFCTVHDSLMLISLQREGTECETAVRGDAYKQPCMFFTVQLSPKPIGTPTPTAHTYTATISWGGDWDPEDATQEDT